MRRIAGIALATLALARAAPALADIPSPANNTSPGHVVLVGRGAAGPDSVAGHVHCVIRDLANIPVPGSHVAFDFSAFSDLSIWAADWFSGLELERADLDGTGGIDALDLSFWGRAYFGGNNALGVGSLCP